jgi:hypothetical protein
MKTSPAGFLVVPHAPPQPLPQPPGVAHVRHAERAT